MVRLRRGDLEGRERKGELDGVNFSRLLDGVEAISGPLTWRNPVSGRSCKLGAMCLYFVIKRDGCATDRMEVDVVNC